MSIDGAGLEGIINQLKQEAQAWRSEKALLLGQIASLGGQQQGPTSDKQNDVRIAKQPESVSPHAGLDEPAAQPETKAGDAPTMPPAPPGAGKVAAYKVAPMFLKNMPAAPPPNGFKLGFMAVAAAKARARRAKTRTAVLVAQRKASEKKVQMMIASNKIDAPGRINGRRFYNINVETTKQQIWDMFMTILLCFVAIVTPYEVCFMQSELFTLLFWVNRMIDISFAVDMVRQCFIPVRGEDFRLIRDNLEIVSRYLRGWFIIDFISIIPFDLLSAAGTGMNEDVRILRAVRLMRLAKLLRVLKANRLVAVVMLYVAVPHSHLKLMKFFVFVVMISHWFACLWYFTSTMGGATSWVTNYGIVDESTSIKYLTSYYWAVMTLTTIGYGDITPSNGMEQMMATMAMLIGASVYAYTVGGICGIFSTMDQDLTNWRNTMDTLNDYMREMRVSPTLSVKLRRYFTNCLPIHKEPFHQEILRLMSPGLREQFAHECFGESVEAVPFLYQECHPMQRDIQNRFVSEVTARLRLSFYPAHELIMSEHEVAENMYIVRNGLVGLNGRLFRVGAYFGEGMLIRMNRKFIATTLTFTGVFALSREDLLDVVAAGGDNYTWIKHRMQRTACRLKVKNGFIGFMQEYRSLRNLPQHLKSLTPPGGEQPELLVKWGSPDHEVLTVSTKALDDDDLKNFGGTRLCEIKCVQLLQEVPETRQLMSSLIPLGIHHHSSVLAPAGVVGSLMREDFISELKRVLRNCSKEPKLFMNAKKFSEGAAAGASPAALLEQGIPVVGHGLDDRFEALRHSLTASLDRQEMRTNATFGELKAMVLAMQTQLAQMAAASAAAPPP